MGTVSDQSAKMEGRATSAKLKKSGAAFRTHRKKQFENIGINRDLSRTNAVFVLLSNENVFFFSRFYIGEIDPNMTRLNISQRAIVLHDLA